MSQSKKIAIILPDALQRIGLRSLLTDYFPPVEISLFTSFDHFIPSKNDFFDFYFTLPDMFVFHTAFFLPKRNKTICIVTNDHESESRQSILTVSTSQEEIFKQLRAILQDANKSYVQTKTGKELSTREKDVLRLIVKGMINKEIADKLFISLNTVLTHRKNITSKLGIKTIPGLTFYAITNGFISSDETGSD